MAVASRMTDTLAMLVNQDIKEIVQRSGNSLISQKTLSQTIGILIYFTWDFFWFVLS